MASRSILILAILAGVLGAGAIWLSQSTIMPTESAAIMPAPEPLPEPPATSSAAPTAVPEHMPVPLPETPATAQAAPEDPSAEPLASPQGDWLDPYYGLQDPDDIEAVRALLMLADAMDFNRFWQHIEPLAGRGNNFAQYLTLAFRDFLVLDDSLLQYGFVEEPYMNQERRNRESPNWLHWLFADWQPSWQPGSNQLAGALDRALAGNHAAQTLLISQPGWFQGQAGLDSNLEELLGNLAGNPYLQLQNLTRVNATTLNEAGTDDAVMAGLAARLNSSAHPLSQWLAEQFNDTRQSPAQRRSQLLDLAQRGYLTAIQEVRQLALTGRGRWGNEDNTPVSLNDAIQVHLQLESQHPTNPLVSVALCELYLAQGDYQASWNYLRKFAYTDDWGEEVEDYSCMAGNHQAYGDLMIERGVVTEAQWQQHLDTIDERRRRIRGQG